MKRMMNAALRGAPLLALCASAIAGQADDAVASQIQAAHAEYLQYGITMPLDAAPRMPDGAYGYGLSLDSGPTYFPPQGAFATQQEARLFYAVCQADDVVRARAISTASYAAASRDMIYTRVVFETSGTLKDAGNLTPADRFVVIVPGGSITEGGKRFSVIGGRDALADNTEYLLVLKQRPGGFYYAQERPPAIRDGAIASAWEGFAAGTQVQSIHAMLGKLAVAGPVRKIH